jgi:hypothetical protein
VTNGTPAPGPGWWLASDGRWYPPRWEYRWFRANAGMRGIKDPDPNQAFQSAIEQAAALGHEGWELVNVTVTAVQQGSRVTHDWVVVGWMKRIVPH